MIVMEHPLLQTYGPLDGWMILLILGTASIGFFLYQVILATRLVMLGAPDNRFDSWGIRVKEVLTGWLGQKRVLEDPVIGDRKSTRLNSSHKPISYAVFCLKKKT